MNAAQYLVLFHPIRMMLISIGLATAFGAVGFGQERQDHSERLLLLERIRLDSDSIIIVDETERVLQDVDRLLSDFNQKWLGDIVREYLPFSRSNDWLAPGMAATDLFGGTYQFYLKSPEELAKSLGSDPETLKSGELEKDAFAQLLERDRRPNRFNQHHIESNDLFLGESYRQNSRQETGQHGRLKMAEELLWPTLDLRTREIILQSGVSVVSLKEPEDFSSYYEKELELLLEELAGAERDWLLSINETLKVVDHQVLGVRYHDRLMEIQARLQLGRGRSFDELVRPNSGAENWRPDLGLEREQLVLAAVIQMNAFPNSAAARTVPKIGLLFGEQQFQWLSGNMLKILTELIGDSWNDLTAGRMALYENDESENVGWLSLIGVADSKDPAAVLRELDRMSKLTSPEVAAAKGFERDEEIARLIGDLAHPNASVANRAETRLALAGRAAVPKLRQAAETGDRKQKEIAVRVLRRIERPAVGTEQKHSVSDPGFWTTLNPGLRFEKDAGKVAGFPSHRVHITADPSKNEEEVAEAMRLMESLFGLRWHTVEVIEVGTHFVFMIGSDQVLLERIALRVSQGTCELNKDLEGLGQCNRHGQLQFWVHGFRFGNLAHPEMVRFRKSLPKEVRSSLQPLWAGANFSGAGLEVKSLVPVEQLRGAVGF